MTLKDTLKFMFILFCAITTFQAIFISIFATLTGSENILYTQELYKLPLIGFLSTLPTLIFIGSDKVSRLDLNIRKVVHLFLTAVIVFWSLTYFEWLDRENALPVAIFFMIIYITGHIIGEMRAKKLADELNKRINASHNTENATHDTRY